MAMAPTNPVPPLSRPITWSRVVMRDACAALLHALPVHTFDVLEISGKKWSDFGFGRYQTADFPAFDLCKEALPETFDLIIAEQVFEHLLYPYRAGRHVLQMLKPGGYFLISTPFLVRVHAMPIDCTRWTELGLKHFLEECGFPLETIQTGSWGNRDCIIANFDDWVMYDPAQHDLRNEPDFPYHVWALAQGGPR